MPVSYRQNIIYPKSVPVPVDTARRDSMGRRVNPRSGGWSNEEEATLRQMMADRLTVIDVSNATGRSRKAVISKAHSLGLTFTGAGARRARSA